MLFKPIDCVLRCLALRFESPRSRYPRPRALLIFRRFFFRFDFASGDPGVTSLSLSESLSSTSMTISGVSASSVVLSTGDGDLAFFAPFCVVAPLVPPRSFPHFPCFRFLNLSDILEDCSSASSSESTRFPVRRRAVLPFHSVSDVPSGSLSIDNVLRDEDDDNSGSEGSPSELK